MDPVNKTALNYKLKNEVPFQKLSQVVGEEGFMQYLGDYVKEFERVKKLPIETNKQIHIDDPNYIIYKLNYKADPPEFEPYNKAAKDLYYGKS